MLVICVIVNMQVDKLGKCKTDVWHCRLYIACAVSKELFSQLYLV